MEEFGGKVRKTMEEMLRIPGVARKTANVVLGSWFGIAVGRGGGYACAAAEPAAGVDERDDAGAG